MDLNPITASIIKYLGKLNIKILINEYERIPNIKLMLTANIILNLLFSIY